MADDRSGAGDPARTLLLLWRHAPGAGTTPEPSARRGPRPGLSVDAVVARAVTLADEHGLERLTMRGVAAGLGVSVMSLYTYVPGKPELLDCMLDDVYLRMPRPAWQPGPWRTRLRAVADANLALFRQHPWVASVGTARPPLGPGLMAKYEHELRAFDGLGLDDVTVDDCLTLLLTFVQAAARTAIAAGRNALDSAMSDEQWWAANAPLLSRVFDDTAYPTAARVGTAAGAAHGSAYDPDHGYTFGLDRVLDGIAVLVEAAGR